MSPDWQWQNGIEDVDATKLEEFMIREKIRRLLDLPHHSDFSIIQWQDPKEKTPQEAAYIIVKEASEPGAGHICFDAAYEHGKFWYVWPDYAVIPTKKVVAWAYAPYDERLNSLGQILHSDR